MKYTIFMLVLLLTGTASCRTHPDLEAEEKAILALHNQLRTAHLEKDARLMFRDSLADYIEVNHGIIKRPGREENIGRFQAYFDAVDFVLWDDVTPPIISFSDDATMATTVVDKIVVTKNKVANNRPDTAYYAWLAVYKKHQGRWQLHRMGSTNR